MSWALRRKFIYLGTIGAIILIILVWIFVSYFYQTPTCSDKKQNQGEVGVDCGGPCNLLCPAQYAPLNVLWFRFVKVTDGDYNVLAYIENPNLNAGANNLEYVFKLYDKRGILLKERFGRTFAPANKVMAVFEADMQTGNQVPARVEFAFTSPPLWLKQASMETGLGLSQSALSRLDTAPRLTAVLTNKTIKEIKKVEAVAIVYNAMGNTMAFSRTIIDAIPGQGTQNIYFNWPKPFTLDGQVETPARTEIVLKVLK